MKNSRNKETTIKRRKLVDQETGEELEATEILQTTDMKDYDFDKVWIGHLALICGAFGYAKMKVFSWLVKHRDRRNNQIIATQEEIAKGADVSRATVARAISELIESDAISMKFAGVYRFNPNLIVYGGPEKRVNIFYSYKEERELMAGNSPSKPPTRKKEATPAG